MIGGQGTWSAVLGPAGASNPGYWTTDDQTLPGGAKTFTGGPWTFTRTAVASSAETIATFKVSDSSYALVFANLMTTNSDCVPYIKWPTNGAGAPTFTNRTSGTRLVIRDTLDASTADHAIGYTTNTLWSCVGKATSSYYHAWYGGTSLLGSLRGDGVLNLSTSTTPYSRLGQKLETNTSAAYGGAALNTWSATAAEASLLDFNRSKSATIGTHSSVASGDALGQISWRGSDGTAFREGAVIAAVVDGTPGASDMPGRLTFWTTPDGSATVTERMRITNAGDVGIGKTPTTGITLDLNGRLGLKSYTVGTLPSASTQAGAIIYVSDAAGTPCVALSDGTNWKRCDDCSVTVS